MTTYQRAERHYWRFQLRRFRWRINQLLAVLTLLIFLLPAAPASARTCPPGYPIPIAHGCRSVAGSGVACNNGYQGTFRQVNGRWIGRCVPGPVAWQVQP